MTVEAKYTPTGISLIRTPLLTLDNYPSTDYPANGHATRIKLQELVSKPEVREALAIASKSLVRNLPKWGQELGSSTHSKRYLQTESSLLRYLIRMTSRPTPFGTFSGVALGAVGERFDVKVASPNFHRTYTTLDAELVWSIVKTLESDERMFNYLHLRSNGIELEVGGRAHLDAISLYGRGSEDSSLRMTPPVLTVLDYCKVVPRPSGEVWQLLCEKYPDVEPETLRGFLRTLLARGLIISNLRPPSMGTDPLNYLLEVLEGIDAAHETFESLTTLKRSISLFDNSPPGAREDAFSQIQAIGEQLDPEAKAAVKVDLRTQMICDSVGKQVANEMGLALTLLARQSPLGPTTARMRGYLRAFADRYGPREVPLLEVLKDQVGLGAPQGYQHPPSAANAPAVDQPNPQVKARQEMRDTYLINLLLRNSGEEEIRLTPQDFEHLTVFPDWDTNLPLSGELFATVMAKNQEAINDGNYSVVVSPRVRTDRAGKAFGRFHELLGPELKDHLRDVYSVEESLSPDTAFAEISYLPYHSRTLNVAVKPFAQHYEIPIGLTPAVDPERVILLQDILVGARKTGLYLRSRRLGKEIRVNATHVLNNFHAPNAVRFLEDLSREGKQLFYSFDWGAAENLAHLPRLRFGRCILSLRTWNIPVDEFPKFRWAQTEQEVLSWVGPWRTRWNVSRWIQWGSEDNMLLLDLENPLHVRLLLEDVSKSDQTKSIKLSEALPNPDTALRNGKVQTYLQEYVVPFRRRSLTAESSLSSEPAKLNHRLVTPSERFQPFGTEWVYLKLYLGATPGNDLLLEQIAPFLMQLTTAESWFFIRYADPNPHIRVRIKFCSRTAAFHNLAHIGEWTSSLLYSQLISNMVLDTYEREVERYGGIAGINISEKLFAQDSKTVLSAIEHIVPGSLEDAVIRRGMVLAEQLLHASGLDQSQRAGLLRNIREGQRGAFRQREQAVQAYLRREHESLKMMILDLESWVRESTPIDFQRAFRERGMVLKSLLAQLRQLECENRLDTSMHSLLSSYIHMTCNRLGLNREQEYDVIMALERTHDGLRHYRPKQLVTMR